jgi:hypothetical protein
MFGKAVTDPDKAKKYSDSLNRDAQGAMLTARSTSSQPEELGPPLS